MNNYEFVFVFVGLILQYLRSSLCIQKLGSEISTMVTTYGIALMYCLDAMIAIFKPCICPKEIGNSFDRSTFLSNIVRVLFMRILLFTPFCRSIAIIRGNILRKSMITSIIIFCSFDELKGCSIDHIILGRIKWTFGKLFCYI